MGGCGDSTIETALNVNVQGEAGSAEYQPPAQHGGCLPEPGVLSGLPESLANEIFTSPLNIFLLGFLSGHVRCHIII
ncbi:hypothetical protein E2C01_015842 [Portunus trituberculatus]|uniref:Uncharacterized protein n=1 Tax=Portunus trituberculatus TaxID=210409 RepID=A0A5B7DPH2_PORTR|nr:hypothetical protein [Portunus trituberculatus]